jgi:hypothetical protein
MNHFIGCELKKVEMGKTGSPLSFRWNNDEFHVKKIIRQWQDFDYNHLSPKKNWRTRHHRNYFQIVTTTGDIFELYCDRGIHLDAPKHWILTRKLDDEKS